MKQLEKFGVDLIVDENDEKILVGQIYVFASSTLDAIKQAKKQLHFVVEDKSSVYKS
jgi:hypothetical protein